MADQKDAISILLAEFQALRAEIAGRSAAQATMMQLAVSAFGVLAGLGFTQYGDRRMLLLIPVISTILGLVWLDHAANISNIGDFIKNQLTPALRSAAEMDALPDYEIFVRRYERSPGGLFRMFGLPPFLIFIFLPVVAMVIALDATTRGWLFWTLQVADVALLALFTVTWLPYLGSPRRPVAPG
jgi:hypothetical protein